MTKTELKYSIKDLHDLEKTMRKGSVYVPDVHRYMQKQKSHCLEAAMLLCSFVQDYYVEACDLAFLKESLGNGSKFSTLFQKDSGAVMEKFKCEKRRGSAILKSFKRKLDNNIPVTLHAEHPIRKDYIRTLPMSKVFKRAEESKKQSEDLKKVKLASREVIAAYIVNNSILKDDIVTLSNYKDSGGIERYKNDSVVFRKSNGDYVELSAEEYYNNHLLPAKEIIDTLNDYFIPLLEQEITFEYLQDLFKKDSNVKEYDVNTRDKLYNLWDAYTKARGIDKDLFPSPLIITPAFYQSKYKKHKS